MGGSGSGISKRSRKPRNGRNPLRGVDRRAYQVRDWITLRERILMDLGSAPSAVIEQLVDRFCHVVGRVKVTEVAAIAGEAIDFPEYLSSVSVLTRLADRLGTHRTQQRSLEIISALEAARARIAALRAESAAPPPSSQRPGLPALLPPPVYDTKKLDS